MPECQASFDGLKQAMIEGQFLGRWCEKTLWSWQKLSVFSCTMDTQSHKKAENWMHGGPLPEGLDTVFNELYICCEDR